MERTTFSPLFYIRRAKLNRNGNSAIFMRLTVNGLRVDTSVRYFINHKLWNTAKGLLKDDPFVGTQFRLDHVQRDFLEIHELKQILEKEIALPRMARVRDIFAFCCLTGLAFTDVLQLTSEHIATDINGMQWIRKARQKTKNMCNVPLMDTAKT